MKDPDSPLATQWRVEYERRKQLLAEIATLGEESPKPCARHGNAPPCRRCRRDEENQQLGRPEPEPPRELVRWLHQQYIDGASHARPSERYCGIRAVILALRRLTPEELALVLDGQVAHGEIPPRHVEGMPPSRGGVWWAAKRMVTRWVPDEEPR